MKKNYHMGSLMRYARMLGFGQVHNKIDPETGLHAIIAIHNLDLGPAIGGCRCYAYTSTGRAVKDVLRLAYMMTLKAAVSNLPHGGAKSVIIKPKTIKDPRAFFHSFGDFIHQMNGNYITACDVGTSPTEMNYIAERTPYVIGATEYRDYDSSPSPHTALGVFRGIQAAVKYKLHRDDLEGLHVAIQGVGSVGYHLARFLTKEGAKITISDTHPMAVEQCVDKLGAVAVDTGDIYDVDADIFAPCALGGTLNLDTLSRLKTPIIAGAANNQLANNKYIKIIQEKNILYAPDFVVNSGGLIHAAMTYDFQDPDLATQKINNLYDTILELFRRADSENLTTVAVAEKLALERMSKVKKKINSQSFSTRHTELEEAQ